MKKSHKFIITILVITIGAILYMYPKPFKHTYEGVQVYENENKVSKINIKLDGKIHKGRFIWQRLKYSEELHGNITIDDKKYSIHPIDRYDFPDENGNHTDNDVFSASLKDSPDDILNDKYLSLDITHDKSMLYINSNSKKFIYPFESDEDYHKVIKRMNEPIYYYD